jgi:hypothetical protein
MLLNLIRRIAGFVLVLTLTAACSLASGTPEGDEVALVFEGAPVIKIASPLAGSVYREGTSINILARVENAGADIRRVDIFVGDDRVAQTDDPNASNAAAFTITTSWVATRTGTQTIRIQVTRGDGVTSAIEQIQVEVRGQVVPTPTVTPTSQVTSTPVAIPTQAAPVQPTVQATTGEQGAPVQPVVEAPAATATSSAPRVRIKQGANIRSGPSTSFEPPIGALPAGAESDILAQAPGGAWLKIKFYNNTGWISSSTVDVVGDLGSVPVEAGPPTPQPVVQQPPPAQNPQQPAAPSSGADLVVEGTPNINPHPFTCGDASEIYVTIKNVGSARSEASRVFLRDVKDGQTQGQTETNVGALEPGASATVGPMYLTVSTHVGVAHVTVIIADGGSSIAESNETNNTYTSQPYTLGAGSQC